MSSHQNVLDLLTEVSVCSACWQMSESNAVVLHLPVPNDCHFLLRTTVGCKPLAAIIEWVINEKDIAF